MHIPFMKSTYTNRCFPVSIFSRFFVIPKSERASIPRNTVVVTASLIVLQVAEHRRLDGDVEGVAFIWPHGDETAAHSEAVQVARHRAVHIRQFLGVEVVARREVERPVLGGLNISLVPLRAAGAIFVPNRCRRHRGYGDSPPQRTIAQIAHAVCCRQPFR